MKSYPNSSVLSYISLFLITILIKTSLSIESPFIFFKEETSLFYKYINASLGEEELQIDPNCAAFLMEKFSRSEITFKFLQDTSHVFSKLGSYQDCKNKIYYSPYDKNVSTKGTEFRYILAYSPKDVYMDNSFLFSICIPKINDCTIDDYRSLLESFNTKTDLLNEEIVIDSLEIYVIGENNYNFKKIYEEKIYIGLIIILIFLLILLCEIFPIIPVKLFKCCFKKNKSSFTNQNNRKSDAMRPLSAYENIYLTKLSKSFDLRESLGEIFGNTGKNIGNDNGISFLKGLRSICLIFFILGKTLEALYSYPVQQHKQEFFNKIPLSFLYFFQRMTKNLFLSISSFSLCYKILCYFDNEVEQKELKNKDIKIDTISPDDINNLKMNNEEETQEMNKIKKKRRKRKKTSSSCKKPKKKVKSDSEKNLHNIPLSLKEKKTNILNENNSNTSSSNSNIIEQKALSEKNLPNISKNSSKSSSSKKSPDSGDLTKLPTINQFKNYIVSVNAYSQISIIDYLVFCFRQFYKYFLYVSLVLIFRYTYYDFISMISENPMWEFIINTYVKKLQAQHLLGIIFLYIPFYKKAKIEIKYDTYDIIILEISFFILCSLIIFISYKRNIRLDIIAIAGFIFSLIIKIGTFLIFQKFYNSSYSDNCFYPSKGFTDQKINYIINNPLYNISCIFIGLFFGLINYVIQKGAKKIEKFKDKIYLNIPIKYVNSLRKKTKFWTFIISLIFIIIFFWCGFSYYFLFELKEESEDDAYAIKFYQNVFINIYYSIDVDIFTLCVFLFIMPYILIGDNSFISFLQHDYWNMLSKPYYSFMLLMPNSINELLYRANTTVELENYNIIFFAIINFLFGIFTGTILYTIFEIPLKKLNKFIFEKKEDIIGEEDDNDLEVGPFTEKGRISVTSV